MNRYLRSLNVQTVLVYFLPAGLFLLNFVLKSAFLDRSSLADDEPFSVYHAQMGIPSIIALLSNGNNPPLFEIILHYWIKAFGISEYSVRFLPCLFSSLAAVFIYLTGLRVSNFRVGLIAALLYTFSNYHIHFAHEARVYSLFTLLTAMSMFGFISMIQTGSRKWLWLVTISNILLSYSHFFGFFIPAIQVGCVLLFKDLRRSYLKPVLLSLIIAGIAYIPYVSILLTRIKGVGAGPAWISPATFPDLYIIIRKFSNEPLVAVVLLGFMLVGAILFLVRKDKPLRLQTWIILIWFFFPFLFLFLISGKYSFLPTPVFFDRYLVFISVAFYLLVAIAVEYCLGRWKYLMLLPVVLMIGTSTPDYDNKRHVREVVELVRAKATPQSIVYFSPYYFCLNFAYYYNKDYFRNYDTVHTYKTVIKDLNRDNIYPIKYTFQMHHKLNQAADQIIFLDINSEFSFPNNKILKTLKQFYELNEILKVEESFKIYVFRKRNSGSLHTN